MQLSSVFQVPDPHGAILADRSHLVRLITGEATSIDRASVALEMKSYLKRLRLHHVDLVHGVTCSQHLTRVHVECQG